MAITITKPTVGGSEDTWGTTINTALDTVVDALNGTSGTVAPDHTVLTINGTDVTSTAAELNILDGVTATSAELNILDGDTAAISTTVVDADRVVFNDAGTMKQVAMSDLKTYMAVPDDLTDLGISDGTSGQFLTTNGAGSFSFATVSSGGGGIELTDLSVGSEGSASGNGSLSYNNSTGVFTYTPPTATGIGALSSVPTTAGAVGTYAFVSYIQPAGEPFGDTIGGSNLKVWGFHSTLDYTGYDDTMFSSGTSTKKHRGGSTLSGSWRIMSRDYPASGSSLNYTYFALAVRVS